MIIGVHIIPQLHDYSQNNKSLCDQSMYSKKDTRNLGNSFERAIAILEVLGGLLYIITIISYLSYQASHKLCNHCKIYLQV